MQKKAVFAAAVVAVLFVSVSGAPAAQSDTARLESRSLLVEVAKKTGRWSLLDKESGVRWPSKGDASPGAADGLKGEFSKAVSSQDAVRLVDENGAAVVFELVDDGRALAIRYEGKEVGDVRVLEDALAVTDAEDGYAVVPCREGLLIRADSGVAFRRAFGTSDYEGCHMNMIGLQKSGAALVVSWDDAYVFPTLQSKLQKAGSGREKGTVPICRDGPKGASHKWGLSPFPGAGQRLTTSMLLRRSARSVCLAPLGKGDWNTIAAGYRRLAEQKGLAVTLREKIRRNRHAERLVGAANVKLWTCLARRMNEESTKEESVRVRWTFDEAAAVAEHLHKDVGIGRCLFILGGWTEGGYDCRHPDNLPANPECGGNDALAAAIKRIQNVNYVACLHDNYQDMYRDAKSWNPAFIEKRPDGSLIRGGRWLGGRAFMVCAPKQFELAMRPQNLPAIQKLFGPWSYFIDTTYAVGPRECTDPNHPIGRNEDIAWKSRLSDAARDMFGLFGSECGREWALPHSDFFEGLVGVSGRYFHNLDPAGLGATVIPFWEMVYHDCEICYGKYGYPAGQAAEYVAHHVLCARPLHYHSIPDHRYWMDQTTQEHARVEARPKVVQVKPAGERTFDIEYAWDVMKDVGRLKRTDAPATRRVFVHFESSGKIRFQDDHEPQPAVAEWRKGQTVRSGPRTVTVPGAVRDEVVELYIGLFDPRNVGTRARLPGCDSQRRVLAGHLRLRPTIEFEPVGATSASLRSCFTRTDGGWAEGLHPTDAFLKTTQEVLGPLHQATALDRLTRLEFLTPDGSVRRATYGGPENATKVVVNFGSDVATVESKLGGKVLLPPWGFVIEAPRFAAFYTKMWNGRDYRDGALFTLQSVDDEDLGKAARLRVFHGFGDRHIRVFGKQFEVPREEVVRVR